MLIEKILFLGQILEIEVLIDKHALSSPGSQNHIFSGCTCVSEKERETVMRITQKQFVEETTRPVFHMRVLCKYYLKFSVTIK